MARTIRVIALAAFALIALVPAQAARAQVANQVTGLTATQHDGYVTLAWTPVAGATDYQIERTPVDAANVPTGASVVTGVWQAQRTITPDQPRFADAGFALGGRYQWRVRARFGTTNPQPYSDPVFGTTNTQWGTGPGASLRTQWELSGNATYTSDVNEYAYEAALVAASPRLRMVELGRTNPVASGPAAPGNRPINMLIIGGTPALTPLPTAAAISSSPTIAYNCNVHGNEPQGRESCLIFARMLAFTDDPHLLDILRQTTVLLVPAINGNGRAANTRGNETGADLNRDHAGIEQPETKAFAAHAPRLHARGRRRPPRGRQRGPAGPLGAPPERVRAALPGREAGARRGLALPARSRERLVARPVLERRRQPRGDPPEHVQPEERGRPPRREPGGRRSDAAGRGHEPRQSQPQVVREPLRGVHDARLLLGAARDDPLPRRAVDRVQQVERGPGGHARLLPVAVQPAERREHRASRTWTP